MNGRTSVLQSRAATARYGGIDAERFEYALSSPLRLRLVAELLEQEDSPLTLEEAVLRTGRHCQDVRNCFRPMINWGVVDLIGEERYRLSPRMRPDLRRTLERVVEMRAPQLDRERHVRDQLFAGMIGVDSKMQLIFEMVRLVSRLDVPVLVTGETGTGKELVARAIHDLSPRTSHYFGAVNCAALTESLFPSEIFGHVRGSFTGAIRDHVGLIERCDNGTLFLDEIGDLSLGNQVKLLRVLQGSTYTRVGDERVRESQFRLISATHRPLQDMARREDFREDLFYRLNVFQIQLPSLRERLDDLPYLVDGILTTQAKRLRTDGEPVTITPAALSRLRRHDWPGNVRELENVVLRSAILAAGRSIDVEHLPRTSGKGTASQQLQAVELASLSEVERRHIQVVLKAKTGNIRATAAILGISRATLYKKIKDYELDMSMFGGRKRA